MVSVVVAVDRQSVVGENGAKTILQVDAKPMDHGEFVGCQLKQESIDLYKVL